MKEVTINLRAHRLKNLVYSKEHVCSSCLPDVGEKGWKTPYFQIKYISAQQGPGAPWVAGSQELSTVTQLSGQGPHPTTTPQNEVMDGSCKSLTMWKNQGQDRNTIDMVIDMAVEQPWGLPEEVQKLYIGIAYATKIQKNTLSLQFNRDIERAHCSAVLSLTRSLWKYLQVGKRHLIHATLVNAVHFHKEQIHAALSAQPDCKGPLSFQHTDSGVNT